MMLSPGVRITPSLYMTRPVEDWSRVRSPGRAARRRKLGHRQNIVHREEPRMDFVSLDGGFSFIAHPEAIKALRFEIEKAPR